MADLDPDELRSFIQTNELPYRNKGIGRSGEKRVFLQEIDALRKAAQKPLISSTNTPNDDRDLSLPHEGRPRTRGRKRKIGVAPFPTTIATLFGSASAEAYGSPSQNGCGSIAAIALYLKALSDIAVYCWDTPQLYYIAGGLLAGGGLALALDAYRAAELIFAVGIVLFLAKGIQTLRNKENRKQITVIFCTLGFLAIAAEILSIEWKRPQSKPSAKASPSYVPTPLPTPTLGSNLGVLAAPSPSIPKPSPSEKAAPIIIRRSEPAAVRASPFPPVDKKAIPDYQPDPISVVSRSMRSDNSEFPYGLSMTVRSTIVISQVDFTVECSGPIGEAFINKITGGSLTSM